MDRRRVVGQIRVQEIILGGGRRSWTVLWPEGAVYEEGDWFLRRYDGEPGTQRTYAYLLVDHLRWLEREALQLKAVRLRDLQRYMGIVGADVRMPLGEPWRVGKRPYGATTLSTAASVLKGFYLGLPEQHRSDDLVRDLGQVRLPSKMDRNRSLLSHLTSTMPANPLAPAKGGRRHPKMLPDEGRGRMLRKATTAPDRMIVTWLYDGGFRIGELCGLHLADLHLRENAECAQARSAHVHICHRERNPNKARAKTKHPWELVNGVVHGGLIRRVSPEMIHTYFAYMTSEYPRTAVTDHGMLLVQLAGDDYGRPLSTTGARSMFRRASLRAGLGRVHPHQARHNFATAVLDASGGNLTIARDAGGAGFDPLFRDDVIHVPRNHPSLRWNCLIAGCDGYIRGQELCGNHLTRWREAAAVGTERLKFLRTAALVVARKRPGCGLPAFGTERYDPLSQHRVTPMQRDFQARRTQPVAT